ncbi:MAG: hypothetical protein JSW61_01770 [Candidatus Thorarchaeota archaeon]|nr:MAG: hypothetical protein JSW61_01770 [Candidatus Thorarchaeota archaeon]
MGKIGEIGVGKEDDPQPITLRFIECITARDLQGLKGLMTENHRFVDICEELHNGRDLNVDNWERFFKL